jgi:hypothetical protein
MKCVPLRAATVALIGALTFTCSRSQAEMHSGRVLVQAVQGDVTYSGAKGVWQKMEADLHLERGTVIKTGANSTADLILGYNGTVLRLTPNSILRLTRLDQEIAGEDLITETKIELMQGALAGTQRKLALPSHLEIVTPQAIANIKGTEYYVRADGAVSVVSGEVTINYNLPGKQGSVRVTIPTGYSFDPATQTVVPTTSDYLQNIIADINTTRNNAKAFKVNGANLVVRPTEEVSPSRPRANNGVGNGIDPQPPGHPPINDGPGTGRGNPGNRGGVH